MRKTFIAMLLAGATIALAAPPPEGALPPGKWWRRAEVVEKLQLTNDQQTRLDQAFKQHATQLVDLKGDVEKRSIELRSELDEATPQRAEVQKLASRVSEARARLFDRELMMLLDMRGVLTPDQWTRVRQVIDHRDDVRPRKNGGMRPPQGGARPGGAGRGRRP